MEKNALAFEVDRYIESNRAYFDANALEKVRQYIYSSDRPMSEFYGLKFKSPVVGTVISFLLGWLGIDRFYTGNYIMGIIKLFTRGGCLIWYVVDWFLIGKAIKQKNLEKLFEFVNPSETNSKNKIDVTTVKNVVTSDEFKTASKDIIDAFKEVAETMDAE